MFKFCWPNLKAVIKTTVISAVLLADLVDCAVPSGPKVRSRQAAESGPWTTGLVSTSSGAALRNQVCFRPVVFALADRT